MRGACLVRPTLEKPERDFIEAALQHLSVHEGMSKMQPPANCITEEEATQMRKLLAQKFKPLPTFVDIHVKNGCFACGMYGHYSRFCHVIYGATKPMECVDMQYGKPDMLKGQEARERKAQKELEQQMKEEMAEKKKNKKKVTEALGAQRRVLAFLPFVARDFCFS